MDNLAHALVGAALGRAVADRHVPRASLIGAIAANMPDLAETLTGYWGWSRSQFLVHHRGITHSLVGALIQIPVLILTIGLITRARTQWRAPWRWLTLCVGITFASHLFMDWQGSYGWRPFLPWSNRWFYLDWVAIVDPFFWLVPLVALAWGAERHWTPLAAALVVGGTITFFVARAHDVVATWVLVVYAIVCVVAAIGWTRYWFGPVGRQRAAAFALLVQRAITQTRDGQAMAQFARFLAAEVDTSGATVYLWDARYARGSRDGWAVVKVRLE